MQTLKNVNVSLNFNVRQPNKKTATSPIYCVIKIDSKQLKVPTGLKVWGYQWDKHLQQCAVNSNMVATDQANNVAANRVIGAVRSAYNDLFVYLCADDSDYNANDIERLIKDAITSQTNNNDGNDMSNKNAIPPKRTITATTLIKRAFDSYYPADKGKASTYMVNVGLVNGYLDYIKASDKGDTPKNFLTQKAVNEYKQALKAEGLAATTINKRVGIVKRLINHLASLSEGEKYGITHVEFECVKDSRSKGEGKKLALTAEQVKAIAECEDLTDKEREYRDYFLLQVDCGQRVSDLGKVVKGSHKITEIDGMTSFTITTQKENIPATIFVTDIVKMMQSKYMAGGFKFADIDSKYFTQHYNETIKTIARKAGLTESVTYMDDEAGHKVEQVKPLYELVTTHIARHTFITLKLREGYSPEKLAYMTGHADDTMIKQIYSHLTAEDKAKAATLELLRVQGKQQASTNTDTDSALIAEQARENHKQRMTIAGQRQMIAIEQQRREIAESLKEVENENVKELLQLAQMHLENGDIEQAQEILKDVQKYGAGVQLLSDEEAAEFEV